MDLYQFSKLVKKDDSTETPLNFIEKTVYTSSIGLLAYLVEQQTFKDAGKNLVETIRKNKNKIFEFTIPEHKYSENFINFTERYFAKKIGRNNFRFIIK